MTGPEHYQAAERWLFKAENQGARGTAETSEGCSAIAQVHATLALAAATALGRYNFETGLPVPDRDDWYRTASEGPAYKRRAREAEQAEAREFAEREQQS